MNFRTDFGAEDEVRLTPFKDDKAKDAENAPFEASSVLVVKANFFPLGKPVSQSSSLTRASLFYKKSSLEPKAALF